MSEECLTQDSILQRPQAGLTFPSYGQQLSPFTLSGGPITTIPKSITGMTEMRRKPPRTDSTTKEQIKMTSSVDTSNLVAYFAADNYYKVNLSTENIAGADPNTSLRFNNTKYTLKFSALHSALWPSVGSLQFSLLFMSDTGKFFHMCIPVKYSDSNENLYLKSWVSGVPVPAGGLTMNDVMNFRGSENDVRFVTLNYCLKYNNYTTNIQSSPKTNFKIKPYTLCLFKNDLYINETNVPEWLQNDPFLKNARVNPLPTVNMIDQTYRRKTFDDIFNYMMGGDIAVYIYGNKDPYLVGVEKHFDDTYTQNAVLPSYYKISTNKIAGSAYSSTQLKDGVRGLKNVKCYPIDLVSQIDEGGNIYIDESTNKPLNTGEVLRELGADASSSLDTAAANDAAKKQLAAAQFDSSVRFWIAFAIIMLIALAFLISIIVYFFSAKPFADTDSIAATPAAAAAVVAATAALPTPAAAALPTPAAPRATVGGRRRT